MKLTLLHSVPAYHALMEWVPLEKTLEAFLGERAVNFFCYAISEENDCLLCSAFFRKILKELDIDFETFAFTSSEASSYFTLEIYAISQILLSC